MPIGLKAAPRLIVGGGNNYGSPWNGVAQQAAPHPADVLMQQQPATQQPSLEDLKARAAAATAGYMQQNGVDANLNPVAQPSPHPLSPAARARLEEARRSLSGQ